MIWRAFDRMFAVIDAAIDACISNWLGAAWEPMLACLFILGWMVNAIAIALALISLEVFLPVMQDWVLSHSRDWRTTIAPDPLPLEEKSG